MEAATTAAAKDPDWIPIVAAQGWVIVTRDRQIQNNKAEIEALLIHEAKMVNYSSADAGTTRAQLEVFMTRWREIEPLTELDAPFIYSLSRTGRVDRLHLTP